MTFIEVIAATVIFGIFLMGFSQASLPLYGAWSRTMAEYKAAKTLHFVSESFRRECSKPDMNFENWKIAVSAAKELDSYEISELKPGTVSRAYRAVCVISGERYEIIGVCGASAGTIISPNGTVFPSGGAKP